MPVAENHHPDWKQAIRPRLRRLAAPAALWVIVVGFYWKITLTRQYSWLDSPDLAYQVLPWFQFQALEWHHGHFPLWDPHEWGGQPLLGQAQPGAAYPLNWLLFLLPLSHGRIRIGFLHWYYVLMHYLGALFAYALCRDLKRSRPASLLAGAAFACAGWMGTVEWPQMFNGAVWAPLVFLFLLRAARNERPRRNAALAGAFLGVSLLSGHHQVPTFLALACGGIFLFLLFRGARWHPQWLAPLAAFALLCFLVGGLQTLPAYAYAQAAVRWVGGPHPVGWGESVPYLVHADFGTHPLSVLGIVIPGIYLSTNPFLGLTLLTLALLALTAGWSDAAVRLLAAVAAGGLLFSLGRYSLLHGLLYALVPMVEKARNPAMAIFIFHFSIIILSSYGIDTYMDSSEAGVRLAKRLLVALSAMAGLAVFVLALAVPSLPQGAPTDARDRAAFAALMALALAALFSAARRRALSPRAACVLLFFLMLSEAAVGGSVFTWHHREQPDFLLTQLQQDADILQFLRNDRDFPRVEVDSGAIPYNWGDWQDMDAFDTYLASLTTNLERVQGEPHARMLYGAKYVLSRAPTRPGQVQVFEGESGVKVFANPEAFPRTWVVHEAASIPKESEIQAALQRPLADLRRQVILVGTPPPLSPCSLPDQTRLVRHESNRVTIEADLGCGGMVILGDTWDSGWQATVDGQPAALWPAYTFLRGVVAGPGHHRIEMRYRPRSVVWGALLTALGLAAACWLGFRRPEPEAPAAGPARATPPARPGAA
ncbi:MAG TPA: hypothetical protein VFA33_06800 [Bryobacteraceae bacterium]|nr:hypothetical protein [Bryobacteraceae bacterium]